MENQVLNTIKTRRSIRAYTDQPLTKKQIETLVDIALHSPSGMNLRPWHITVVTDKELINQMDYDLVSILCKSTDPAVIERLKARNNKMIYNAPALFFITVKRIRGYEDIDAGIMAQNICLAAKSMGLDSVMIAMLRVLFADEAKWAEYKAKLQFADDREFVISVAVGHANQEAPPREIVREDKVTYIG